jgi:hypothetical protein
MPVITPLTITRVFAGLWSDQVKRDLFLTMRKRSGDGHATSYREDQHRAVDPRLPRAGPAGCRQGLGQHFLYANLANAQSKQDVLDLIAQQFMFPSHFGKNFDALYDCMTDPLHKSGPQPGFHRGARADPGQRQVRQGSARAAAGHLPRHGGLLGRPEDTVPVFLFFSVARSAHTSQAERANEAPKAEGLTATAPPASNLTTETGEKMPTDKLVDVSPLALRMSSPFNAGYWLAAA